MGVTRTFVNLDGTITSYEGPLLAMTEHVPGGGLLNASTKNAAKFSRTFKGTLSKLPAKTRGAINRRYNKVVKVWNCLDLQGTKIINFIFGKKNKK